MVKDYLKHTEKVFKTKLLLKYTLLVGFILSFSVTKAKVPPLVDTSFIIKKCKDLVPDSNILRLDEHFFDSFILVNDTLGYLNPNGTLHLFEVVFKDSTIVSKLSISKYHGSTFQRQLFYHNDKIYSFGGVGLFNSFGKLIEFDFNKGEWFLKKINNLPTQLNGVISSWLYEDNLFVLFKLLSEDNNYSFGAIDLKKSNYNEEFQFQDDSPLALTTPRALLGYSQSKYSIFQKYIRDSKCKISVFNNETGELTQNTFYKDKSSINGISYAYIIGNMMYYRDNNRTIDSLDISKTKNYLVSNFPDLYLSRHNSSMNPKRILYLIIGLIIILLMSFFTYLSVKKSSKSNLVNGSLLLENKLINIKGSKISRDELDAILEITHLNQDSSKTLRSRLINEINDSGKVSIERERNPKDKRFFDYKIN